MTNVSKIKAALPAPATEFHFRDEQMNRIPGTLTPLPCPWCATHGDIEFSSNDGTDEPWSAVCGFCRTHGPNAQTRKDAATEWNWRGGSDPALISDGTPITAAADIEPVDLDRVVQLLNLVVELTDAPEDERKSRLKRIRTLARQAKGLLEGDGIFMNEGNANG